MGSFYFVLLNFAFVAFVVCIVVATPHVVQDQASLHVPSHGSLNAVYHPPITSRSEVHEVCKEKSKKSAFVYARCPEKEMPFSEELFRECGGLIQFGCTLKPVTTHPGYFTCSRKEADPEPGTVVCPGDKIVFNNIKINEREFVRYAIDLRADPLSTDVYFLSDATGSMHRAIDTAKTRAQALLDIFSARPDTQFGVGYYRDEVELHNGFFNAQSITSNVHAVKAAINSIVANGGGDRDEANLVALYKIATDPAIGWRPRSRRILVYFGDQPGHEPTCGSVGRTLTRIVVSEALYAERISVLAVDFGGLDAAPVSYGCGISSTKLEKPGQATHIIEATGGAIVKASDQSKLIELIEGLVIAMPRQFSYRDNSCAGKVLSIHSPTMPVELYVGSSLTVTNSMELRDGVCVEGGTFNCQIIYTEGGADMKPTDVEFVNILGCGGGH